MRDGVRVGYEVFDRQRRADGPVRDVDARSVHTRQWKVQVPFLARHFRVVIVEGRGNGARRPAGRTRGLPPGREHVADARRGAGRHRGRPRGRSSGSLGVPGARCGWRPGTRTGWRASSRSRPRRSPGPRRRTRSTRGREPLRPGTAVRAEYRGCVRVLPVDGVHRPALDQAARGRPRAGPAEHRARTLLVDFFAADVGPDAATRREEMLRSGPLSRAGRARRARRARAVRGRRRGGGVDRRRAGDAARRRARACRCATRCGSTCWSASSLER